jgi:hypothetical protein
MIKQVPYLCQLGQFICNSSNLLLQDNFTDAERKETCLQVFPDDGAAIGDEGRIQ